MSDRFRIEIAIVCHRCFYVDFDFDFDVDFDVDCVADVDCFADVDFRHRPKKIPKKSKKEPGTWKHS